MVAAATCCYDLAMDMSLFDDPSFRAKRLLVASDQSLPLVFSAADATGLLYQQLERCDDLSWETLIERHQPDMLLCLVAGPLLSTVAELNYLVLSRGRFDFSIIQRIPYSSDVTRIQSAILALAQAYLDEFRRRIIGTVYQITHDGVIVTDHQNQILWVNSGFTRITGYQIGEVLGKNPSILRSGRQPRSFYVAMWATILKDGYWEGEVWNRKKSGEFYSEWLRIHLVKDDYRKAHHHVAVFSDLTLVKIDEERMFHLAYHDALTNLPNRVLLMDRLRQALQYAERNAGRLAILYLDLDRFKPINDQEGHLVGDAVLIQVASRIQSCIRKTDTLARVGGDEFVLAMTELRDASDVERVAKTIVDSVKQPVQLEGKEFRLSCSIGISFYPEDGQEILALIERADAAMYRAKDLGGSCFHSASVKAGC